MTIGELATYFDSVLYSSSGGGGDSSSSSSSSSSGGSGSGGVEVIKMKGWSRLMTINDYTTSTTTTGTTGIIGDGSDGSGSILLIPPSPNLPTVQAILSYPVVCFLEATSVSEGRGKCSVIKV